ncbi:phage putative head morphogenesis protein, SPP1 gp7 family [Caloramator quimbayensis]|uniref:Phage putative head morphogenesis protein, SPP1 gp7 family n=1 Tax=Caloramator quimbayensis TaxID=1147123 RepID=A0A1T4YDI7_9CLOT|nr:minor capsid protein [Caloramator quimbayensis]SKA99381.1 phage putative head morphogenesis protein, SPP1 gp7 family [Caloramator quimbayensis]
MSKVNPKYRRIIENINAEGEKYTNEEMKEVYKQQAKAKDEVQKLIGALFIKFAVDGFLKFTQAQKDKLVHEIGEKLRNIGKNLGSDEIDKITSILEDVYIDTYYKNAYVIDIGTEKDLKFDLLDEEIVKRAVNKEIDGMLFSDRIWQNKAALIDKLKQSISECMDGKTTIDKIGRDISRMFNVGAYESYRLAVTELTRVQAKAQEDIAKNIGIKKQMWSATLDTHTCKRCASLDGKVFDIDDPNKPQMPLHPLDRCCWINAPDEDWKPDKRIDNLTKEEIDWKDYKEWYEEKVAKIKELEKIKEYKEPLPKRHYINSITIKSIAKDKNTIIMPNVDVKKDIEDIKKGLYNKTNDTYVVNGRMYGCHDSRFYPIKGDGFVTIDRAQFKALQYLIKNGNDNKAMTVFKNLELSKEKIDEVLKIWEVRNK